MSKTEDMAIGLLHEVLKQGYKEENSLTDSSWNIPIELKWRIEKFVQVVSSVPGEYHVK